jgi:hypothetical protein
MQAVTCSPSSRESGNSCGSRVQFARYVDGRLQLLTARTSELDYYAISHVWEETQWLSVSGVDHEILVSREKVTFIESTLPSLVGAAAFWMDTLTVNQRDQAEVIATVQAIPAIFRDAVKTIAVRQGDGFYNCCLKAVKDFTEWEDYDLLEEARKALDIIWATFDPYIQDAAMQSDGYYFRQKLRSYCHPKLMKFLVLLTAMVSCQVPLSAAIWARNYFVPVRVNYKKFHVIGLLTKHAVANDISSGQVRLSGSRHLSRESRGKDLALVDPIAKMPMGLLPDFLHLERTVEEYVERISVLYRGLAIQVTPQGSACHHLPLDNIQMHVQQE